MKYLRPKGDPAKTLAIILIGACLMLAIDLFVLGGKDVIWPKRPAPEKTPEEVSALRDQHRRYLDEGLDNLPRELAQPKFKDDVKLAESSQAPLPYEEFYEGGESPPENIVPMAGETAPETGEEFSDPYFKTEINLAQPPPSLIPDPAEIQEPDAPDEQPVQNTEIQAAPEQTAPAAPESVEKAAVVPVMGTRPPVKKGTVVIIIDDMGLTAGSRAVEKLPGPLTLAYLPYAQGLPEQTTRARKRGHELMVHMPMQPMNGHVDGGPTLLKVDQSEERFLELLRYNLSQFGGYVGVNNHMGSRLTQNRTAMDRVMKELSRRGLYFIDSKTIGSSVAAAAAADGGLAYAERDIFLDHEINMPFIRNALKKVEWTARHKGYAIAIGHPHDETIRALAEWLPTLKEKGLTLRPASAVVRRASSTVVMASAPLTTAAPTLPEAQENKTEEMKPPQISSPVFKVTEQGIIVLPQTPQPQAPQHE